MIDPEIQAGLDKIQADLEVRRERLKASCPSIHEACVVLKETFGPVKLIYAKNLETGEEFGKPIPQKDLDAIVLPMYTGKRVKAVRSQSRKRGSQK